MNNSLTSKCLVILMISLIALTSCNNADKKNSAGVIDKAIQGQWKDLAGDFKMIIAEKEVIKISSDTINLTVKSIEVIKKEDCPECEALIIKVIYNQQDTPTDIFTFYNFTTVKEALKLQSGNHNFM